MAVALMKKTLDLLLKKIESLKAEVRENSINLQKAADFGDLKENAEYKTAREHQEYLFGKLRRFEQYLDHKVIDVNDLNPDTVTFGSSITIINNKTGKTVKYNILGPVEYELESMENVVTYTSPLARQLIGRKKGEEVEVQLPNRVDSIKILEIEKII
ncbi:GreA/GreB family elongation factor [candidate division KSB1 bacterium]